MIPSGRSFTLLGLWGALALLDALQPLLADTEADTLLLLWMAAGLVLAALMGADLWQSRKGILTVERRLPGSFSIASRQAVMLQLHNQGNYAADIDLIDHVPQHFTQHQPMPFHLSLQAGEHYLLSYDLTATKRGICVFPQTEIRYSSRWKLWKLRQRIYQHQSVRVYPNFLSIARLDSLHDKEQERELGLHHIQRRGEGSEFMQLREFREGDNLRHVDWKATARQRKLITREYQEERGQEIIFLLDCGRNMRSKDDTLSHFDHALNAMLLAAYVALKYGDAVGMLNFASNQKRHLSPVKGQSSLNTLLNHTYDLESTLHNPDFLHLANQVLQVQKRRALMILLTNLGENEESDLLTAVRLLGRQHLVIVANLQERIIKENIDQPITTLDEALSYVGSIGYLQRRKQMQEQLTQAGAIIVDSSPQQLHTTLIQQYLSLKRQGRL